MRTILKSKIWKILRIFYENKNTPLHLRKIARKLNYSPGSLKRYLIEHNELFKIETEANLTKYSVKTNEIPLIFPVFDAETLNSTSLLRKNAIKYYIEQLKTKPILIILFGSTAKGTFRKDSDIDIIEVFNKRTKTDDSAKYAEAQTGIKISRFQMSYQDFLKELKLKEDNVIQSGLKTGFPVFNAKFFYEVTINERISTEKTT